MMSHSHDYDFVRPELYDDVVWKPSQNKALGTLSSRLAGQVGEGNDLFLEEVECCFYGLGEFPAQAWTLTFIPSCSLGYFLGCLFEDSNPRHYRRASRSCSLRRNSFRSMSLAVPASISPSRRTISLSHSSKASGSEGSSRLLTRVYASSARSDSGSVSTSERNLSRLELSMGPTRSQSSSILLPTNAPNKSLERTVKCRARRAAGALGNCAPAARRMPRRAAAQLDR